MKSLVEQEIKKDYEEKIIPWLNMEMEVKLQVIKESNKINYDNLDCLNHYPWYADNTNLGILIFECYTLLQIIKNSGITEDNYNAKEEVFDRAVSHIETYSGEKPNIAMFPKPSFILYVLKYHLQESASIDKNKIKAILEIVANKPPSRSRMPRNKEDTNQHISYVEEIKSHIANSTEGFKKWSFYSFTIFSLPTLGQFEKLVYNPIIFKKVLSLHPLFKIR